MYQNKSTSAGQIPVFMTFIELIWNNSIPAVMGSNPTYPRQVLEPWTGEGCGCILITCILQQSNLSWVIV
jgi:hypothetical protein